VNSTVRGPAIIGAGTRSSNSYVGPYSSIGVDCEIIDSEIEHSVVLEQSRIVGIPGSPTRSSAATPRCVRTQRAPGDPPDARRPLPPRVEEERPWPP
jgi:hypothetical protein